MHSVIHTQHVIIVFDYLSLSSSSNICHAMEWGDCNNQPLIAGIILGVSKGQAKLNVIDRCARLIVQG